MTACSVCGGEKVKIVISDAVGWSIEVSICPNCHEPADAGEAAEEAIEEVRE